MLYVAGPWLISTLICALQCKNISEMVTTFSLTNVVQDDYVGHLYVLTVIINLSKSEMMLQSKLCLGRHTVVNVCSQQCWLPSLRSIGLRRRNVTAREISERNQKNDGVRGLDHLNIKLTKTVVFLRGSSFYVLYDPQCSLIFFLLLILFLLLFPLLPRSASPDWPLLEVKEAGRVVRGGQTGAVKLGRFMRGSSANSEGK